MKRAFTQWETYRGPFLLGAVTLVGLLSALLGDGVWDTCSWLLLAVPIIFIAGCLLRPGA